MKKQSNPQQSPFKTVPVQDACGMTLAHDMTEIVSDTSKGTAFKRGHRVQAGDICRLMRMGKNNLYVLDLNETQIHEDEAVFELASALAGPGVEFSGTPSEGKLELYAAYPGLFRVNVEALTEFNMLDDVMCASIHTHIAVNKGDSLAATRHPGHSPGYRPGKPQSGHGLCEIRLSHSFRFNVQSAENPPGHHRQ